MTTVEDIDQPSDEENYSGSNHNKRFDLNQKIQGKRNGSCKIQTFATPDSTFRSFERVQQQTLGKQQASAVPAQVPPRSDLEFPREHFMSK